MMDTRQREKPIRRELKAMAIGLCLLMFAVSLIPGGPERAVAASAEASAPGAKLIALTFDDGPYSKVTSHILDVLEQYGVVATFFVVGNRVHRFENTIVRMEALGCEVGNHSFSHADLTLLSTSRCVNEIERTNIELERVLGHKASVVRPPYGHYNASVRKALPYPLVLWDVDTRDYRPQNASDLARAVIKKSKSGCVILMHDHRASTAEAMDVIIPALVERGFTFVTISELIKVKGRECSAIKLP